MLKNPSVTLSIHGRPERASSYPENSGGVCINFPQNSSITFYCQSAAMALDMEAAINAVIAKHDAKPAVIEAEAA